MADRSNGIEAVAGVNPDSTIGDMLDRQVERFADRDALVNVETGERFTYAGFRDEVDRVARGLMALGIERGQHVGILGHQLLGVGAHPVRHGQDRGGDGQREPGLPHPRAGLPAGAVGGQRPGPHWQIPQLRLR